MTFRQILSNLLKRHSIISVSQQSFLAILLFCLFSLAINFESTGQSIEDLKNIDIETLTDEQILEFKSEIESRGLSQNQLVQLAKLNGVSDTKIQAFQMRLASVSEEGGSSTVKNRTRMEPQRTPLHSNESTPPNTKLFGSSLFGNTILTFAPNVNIPTPKNYVLGAGDELFIDIWGDAQKSYQLSLNPEGSVLIPDVGPIFLSGKTMEEAEKIIVGRIKSIFSSLGDRSYALVTLGQTRSIKIHIVGEVKYPGTYTISPFSSSFNALYQAKGPNENGSFRNIKVRRGNEIIETLDIYDFLLAKPTSSLTLEDQDVIIVPPYGKRVEIVGKVKRPAIYEVETDESLEDLLELSGGFNGDAYTKRIRIVRNAQSHRSILTIENQNFQSSLLQDGDQISVSGIDRYIRDKVYVGGPVYQPGNYQLQSNMTLGDLINQADRLKPQTYMKQALLYRKDENFDDFVISINLLNSADLDLALKPQDSLVIKRKEEVTFRQSVKILGDVMQPGSYNFIDSLTISQLLYLCGGYQERADTTFAEIGLPLLKNLEGKERSVETVSQDQFSQYKLPPNATVLIRRDAAYLKEQLVLIEGEVVFPGYYAINEGEDQYISDLISRAGGIKDNADVYGVSLIRVPEYLERNNTTVNRLKIEIRDNASDNVETELKQLPKEEFVGLNFIEIMKKPKGKYDLLLRNNDIVSVPLQIQTIRVSGEVLRPGSHLFEESFSFKDYISAAGGFSEKARANNAYLVYSNNNTVATKSFLGIKKYPKLRPGSEIIVPTKLEKRKLTAQEVLGITTSIVALGLLIDRFGR